MQRIIVKLPVEFGSSILPIPFLMDITHDSSIIMVTHILVAVDGSEPSYNALRTALDWARGWNAQVHTVHVAESGQYANIPPYAEEGGIDPSGELILQVIKQEAERIKQKISEIGTDAGIRIEQHYREGDPRHEIIELAQSIDADLIMVGSRGKGALERLLIGSVSSYIAEHSHISTVIVRG